MKPLAIALGALAVTLLAVALAGAIAAGLEGPSYTAADLARVDAEAARYELERARAERQLALMHELYWLDGALAVAWKVLPLLAVTGGLAYVAARGAASARFRRDHIDPDSRGLLPVPIAELDAVAPKALGAFHAARQLEAAKQNVPHTLSYAPHHAPRLDYRGDAGRDALPAPAEPARLLDSPTFAALLDADGVGKGHPLILGYDLDNDGAELPGSWADLYSTVTAGLPGTGKTTSQRFFACQTALHGARFVVCDPHAGAGPESLAATLAPLRAAYLVEPAEEPRDILAAARYVAELGEARVKGRSADRWPLILWVDELTGLLGRSDVGADLAEVLERIAQEHRKVAIFLAASGQIWTASRATSELRDSMASVLCHRMKRSQARLLLPTEEAAQVERLATGEAILWRTSGVTSRVKIPLTTGADVARVGQLLAGGAPSAPASPAPSPGRPIGFRAPAPEGVAEGALEGANAAPLPGHQDAGKLTAEEAAIVAAFIGGKSPAELAEQLAGTKSGRAYVEAARRVAELLRRALGGRGAQPA